MSGSTSNSPKASIVLPHYAFAGVSFLVVNVLLFFSREALVGHYFHPKLLAVTHLAILGWAVMVIFGAIYQLLPVLLKVALYSESLAMLTFCLLASGAAFLVVAFWIFEVGLLMQAGGCLVFFSFLCFSLNVYLTARNSGEWDMGSDCILTSALWLLLTGLVGILMVFNFQYPFLTESHLEYLKLHAHLGIIGWFLLLIIGVASKLFPMFLLVHEVELRWVNGAYYLINAGLAMFILFKFLLNQNWLLFCSVVTICLGLACFLAFCIDIYLKRTRKDLDKPMRQSFTSLILLALPLGFFLVVLGTDEPSEKWALQLSVAYGFSIFFGFITALILGQTFKTLPFIVWTHKYQSLVGKKKTPLPKDLYHNGILILQNRFYITAFTVLVIGIICSESLIIMVGSAGMIIAAAFFLFNIGKIFSHLLPIKPKYLWKKK